MITIPIFPLNIVLFPEGILPLRIFEPRYFDMVTECLKQDLPFGVCLISKGGEVGEPAEVCPVGTTARIIDWDRLENGMLALTASGESRFKLIEKRIRKNKLMEADIVYLDHDEDELLPAEYQLFSDLLRQIADKFELPIANEHEKFADPYWVGSRLSELLPIENDQKQNLLEIDEPLHRLSELQTVIGQIDMDELGK